uniref:Corrinoid adenosyltransferase MMAB n=1 Tax=Auxenochlorella protothecoides TaxID=3075 RepID=A0A1D2A1B6_AUXPR
MSGLALLATGLFRRTAPSIAVRSYHSTGISMKIYTKTGDKGTSSLYTGERRAKDDATFAALGDVDELNSAIGVAGEHVRGLDPSMALQSRLLDVGSAVATPLASASEAKLRRAAFDPAHTPLLEAWIDEASAELPPLTNFILPSGGHAAAALHLARSVCRRAERAVVPLVGAGATDEAVGVYLNRLSDYLFTAARLAAKRAGAEETVYKKGA